MLLSRQRTADMSGPHPIQISEMRAYADLIGMTDPDDRLDLVSHLVILDEIWMADAHKKREAARKKAAQTTRRKSPPTRRRSR